MKRFPLHILKESVYSILAPGIIKKSCHREKCYHVYNTENTQSIHIFKEPEIDPSCTKKSVLCSVSSKTLQEEQKTAINSELRHGLNLCCIYVNI